VLRVFDIKYKPAARLCLPHSDNARRRRPVARTRRKIMGTTAPCVCSAQYDAEAYTIQYFMFVHEQEQIIIKIIGLASVCVCVKTRRVGDIF